MDQLDITGAPGAYAEAEQATGTSVNVHAGFPNAAAERSGAPPLSLDKLLIRHPSSSYYFRIRGHSWQRYGVFDGDIALIDRALTPGGRDLVVWWQENGEFYLTRFARSRHASVWGTVTAIIHQTRDKKEELPGSPA